jgi:hypothetical protein
MAKRRSAEHWGELVRRWRSSGLTAKEFSKQAGVSDKQLGSWAWKLGLSRRQAACELPRFVPLQVERSEVPLAETALEVVRGAHVVRVRWGFDAATLAAVLKLLEQSSC